MSARFTREEIVQLDRTAKACGLSRSELIRARSLGKLVTVHELADWAEAELAKNSNRRNQRAGGPS